MAKAVDEQKLPVTRPQDPQTLEPLHGMHLKAPLLFPARGYSDSVVDSLLKRTVRYKHDAAVLDDFEQFLSDQNEDKAREVYHQLGQKPAQILKPCFWFTLYNPSEILSPVQVDKIFEAREFSGNLLVPELFTGLRGSLATAEPASVSLCCMVRSASGLDDAFSYFLLFRVSALQDNQYWARFLLVFLLLQCDRIEKPEAISILHEGTDEILKPRPLRLPSEDIPRPTLAQSINYAWPHKVPVFKTYEYYSKRPYKSLPNLETVRGFCKDELRHMNLVFETSPGLERFQRTLRSLLASSTQDAKADPGSCASSRYQANAIMLAIHRLIIGDIRSVMEEARERAETTVVQCRAHPGRSAYLYILFLKDHIKLGLGYAEKASQDLQHPDDTHKATKLYDLHLGVRRDLIWLLSELQVTISHLDGLLGQVKTLQELKGSQTSSTMNVLVAIYVPLAFVSSYFGMNTIQFNGGNVDTSTFWAFAIPLMVLTILTPLSATIIARITLTASLTTRQFSQRRWPFLLDLANVVFFLGVPTAHVIAWRVATDHYFVSYFHRISPDEPIIVNCALALLALLKGTENAFMRTIRSRKWVLLWASVAAISLLCAGLSVLDTTPATLLTPYCGTVLTLALRRYIF